LIARVQDDEVVARAVHLCDGDAGIHGAAVSASVFCGNVTTAAGEIVEIACL
jgi:hypothetical protein